MNFEYICKEFFFFIKKYKNNEKKKNYFKKILIYYYNILLKNKERLKLGKVGFEFIELKIKNKFFSYNVIIDVNFIFINQIFNKENFNFKKYIISFFYNNNKKIKTKKLYFFGFLFIYFIFDEFFISFIFDEFFISFIFDEFFISFIFDEFFKINNFLNNIENKFLIEFLKFFKLNFK